MESAWVALSGMFAGELLAVVFCAGKLFQKVKDIERRLTRIEDNAGCGEDKE